MPLNKPSGNMYDWAWTWNPAGGECLYDCKHCYVKRLYKWPKLKEKYTGKTRIIESELEIPLKKLDDGKAIFVQSCGDLFASFVPTGVIGRVLTHCRKYPENVYLFQTKYPIRFRQFMPWFPPKTILGTTLETNREYPVSKAPRPLIRYSDFLYYTLRQRIEPNFFMTMVSVEPIMDFDLYVFTCWLTNLDPDFVSIGADSGNNGLSEPTWNKTMKLIKKLEAAGIEVRRKKNLERLRGRKRHE